MIAQNLTTECIQCGQDFKVSASQLRKGKKLCSRTCTNDYKKTPAYRFWRFVQKTEKCWIWLGTTRRGYGRCGVNIQAHRYSYELHKGTIPDGLKVLHTCDTPSCVNPDHLYVGTNKDNSQDAVRRGRIAHGERQGSSKLTAKDITAIRSMFATGYYTRKDIAKVFKVSASSVALIVAGKTWRHVEMITGT